MKKIIYRIIALSLVVISCDDSLTDFTDVVNPNLSEDNVIGQPNSAQAWLGGIRRQLSLTSNEIVTISEIASDNYINTQTFYNQALDRLDITIVDNDFSQLMFDIARLREMTDFGLESVAPNDVNATENTIAEYHFYKGLSYIYAGEYFSAFPEEPEGALITSEQNFQNAVASFNTAIGLVNDPKYHLALVRAYHNLGDKSNAVLSANTAISLNSELIFSAEFDQLNGPADDNDPEGDYNSTIESALYARGTFDDLQPLPSLDFLDPKYSFLSNDVDQPTPVLKVEEAYLVLAEAQLSDMNLVLARETMIDLVDLVNSRETRTIDDSAEDRDQDNPGSRPDNSSVQVRYTGDTAFRTGLVLNRDQSVTVPTISGTSITNADINALTSIEEALETLYLMRQEIFIAEGRRIIDLGVKYVIHENELLLNDNVTEDDQSLVPVIPSFIDAIKTELDAFTYDASAGTVTITHNVNEILVNNRTSDLVIPFF